MISCSRVWIAALVLCALAACATTPPQASALDPVSLAQAQEAPWQPAAQLAQTGALDRFFNDLSALRAGHLQHVRIIQIGDSHTAADFFTGELRARFQADFGNAGVGTRAAGLPYRGVRQANMSILQTGIWHYHDSLSDPAFPDYGISGFTAVSATPGATLSLTVADPAGFDSGFVDIARRPAGGRLQIVIDGTVIETVSAYGPPNAIAHVRFTAHAAHTLTLVAKTPGIEILDWNTERAAPGVVLDSFGVVGATAAVTTHWNQEILARQLAFLRPSLIIVAYGTNEGASPDFDAASYGQTYGTLLAELHKSAPASAVLIISPTDGAHHPNDCTSSSCPWETLPSLAAVRTVQAKEAHIHFAGLWDASVPERYSGGINGWADVTPPLARPDHVHFTIKGYDMLADWLYRWLTDEMNDAMLAHGADGYALPHA
jgi:lysophospholipase L1-like esterase